jgi:hypothetical protein
MRLLRRYLYFCTSKASKLTQNSLAGNIVQGNEGGGAVVTGYSAPVFSEDRFSDNGFVAVGVKEHSTVLIFFLFFFALWRLVLRSTRRSSFFF